MPRIHLLVSVFLALAITVCYSTELIELPAHLSTGTWGKKHYCPRNSWVKSFEVKVQASQGRGVDDTALNGIRFHCYDKAGTRKATVTSKVTDAGVWLPSAGDVPCTENAFYNTIEVRSEPDQGSGDNTGLNNIRVKCSNSQKWRHFRDAGIWGSWTGRKSCSVQSSSVQSSSVKFSSEGSAICGLQTRGKDWIEGSDNSGLTGLKVLCCSLTED